MYYIYVYMYYIYYIYIWFRVPLSYPPHGMGPQVSFSTQVSECQPFIYWGLATTYQVITYAA